jgi:hypothetical protein
MIDRSVMLDGDFYAAINPYDFSDSHSLEYLYRTMSHLINFHRQNNYQHFIINYVFESEKELSKFLEILRVSTELEHHCYLLRCNHQEQKLRIINRHSNQVDWELKRSGELNLVLELASKKEFIGEPIDTSAKSVHEVAQCILDAIELDPLISQSK